MKRFFINLKYKRIIKRCVRYKLTCGFPTRSICLKKWQKKFVEKVVHDCLFCDWSKLSRLLLIYDNLLKEYYYNGLITLKELMTICELGSSFIDEVGGVKNYGNVFNADVVIIDEFDLYKEWRKKFNNVSRME